jgi:hypothetical protein
LQPGSQIRGFPDYRTFLRGAFTDYIADYHGARCDADAGRQRDTRLQRRDRVGECQACAQRSFRVVLVGLGIAEIGEHAVAHVARNVTAVSFDGRRSGVLIRTIDLAKLLGIQFPGQFRGPDQVSEHDRQLPALGFPGR